MYLAMKSNQPIENLVKYTDTELLALCDGNTVDDKTLLSRVVYVLYAEDNKVQVITGEAAIFAMRDFQKVDNRTFFKGIIANKGFVRARARVIDADANHINILQEFLKTMESGEVLVAETTEPSIIVACKKASAILTNQGGMMSHAAIVSRELNIPCIVGMGDITKVLKTGDMIEVDANSGVVRKV